jgi:gliding motility-associated protein GldE
LDTEPPLTDIIFATDLLYILTFAIGIPVAAILLFLLLICSALIAGSEVAFFSLGSQDLDHLRNEKSRTAHRILHLRSISRRLLATILITNNLVNIAIVIVSAYIISHIFPPALFIDWAEAFNRLPLMGGVSVIRTAAVFNFLLTVVIVTFLLVMFGEVAPRVYAKLNNLRIARMMAQPLQILVIVFGPLSRILAGWSRRIESKLQNRSNGSASDAGIKDDIDKAIDLAMPRDANSRLEAGILKSIIKFNDVPVKQIMRSRVDVVAIDDQMPFTKLKEIIRGEGYSRMPVYKENLDNVLGMLYVKDLIGHMDRGDEFVWQELVLKQVLYVPESKKINELLKEFQKEHMHMGIVVDEYGGTAGLVTLEDVMEEVIGEIKDEFDEAVEGDYRKIDQYTYLFDGKVLLNDVCRIVGIDSSELDHIRGDADSLAGLILELSGKMPERGEEFKAADISFTVISVSSRRVEKIRVRLKENK